MGRSSILVYRRLLKDSWFDHRRCQVTSSWSRASIRKTKSVCRVALDVDRLTRANRIEQGFIDVLTQACAHPSQVLCLTRFERLTLVEGVPISTLVVGANCVLLV